MLRNIYLYGAIADKFGPGPYSYDVHGTYDLICALRHRFPEFRTYVREYPDQIVLISDTDKTNARGAPNEDYGDAAEVHIIPNHEGSGLEIATALFGMTAGSIGAIVVNMVASMVLSMALGAIAQSLAPQPNTSGGGQEVRPEEKPSMLYNGPQNVTEQGYPVPVIYGTHMTGSIVVSAGSYDEQLLTTPSQSAPPSNGGGTSQPTSPAAETWQWGG